MGLLIPRSSVPSVKSKPKEAQVELATLFKWEKLACAAQKMCWEGTMWWIYPEGRNNRIFKHTADKEKLRMIPKYSAHRADVRMESFSKKCGKLVLNKGLQNWQSRHLLGFGRAEEQFPPDFQEERLYTQWKHWINGRHQPLVATELKLAMESVSRLALKVSKQNDIWGKSLLLRI